MNLSFSRIFTIVCFFFSFPFLGLTQNDSTEIKELVLQLFDGMRAADSLMVKDAFHPIATMYTTGKPKGKSAIRESEVSGFASSVGMPHDEIYDERLGKYSLNIDDVLGSMEVEYYFFLGETFSHCGTNFFTFFKSESGWKIISIADTRRKEPCELPSVTW